MVDHSDRYSRAVGLGCIQVGLLLAVLVFTRAPILDSDNFILGKALVLSIGGMTVTAALLVGNRGYSCDKVEWFLLLALALAFASSLLSLNWWQGKLPISGLAASAALFWGSRSITITQYRLTIFIFASGAVGLIALTALAEAYTGVHLSLRPPGGTIGNRNRMAHLIVIGLPALALLTTRVRDRWMLGLLLLGSALAASALFLSRARGAWLAGLAVICVAGFLTLLRRGGSGGGGLPFGSRTPRRMTLFVGAASLGILAALLLPNQLNWASPTPYRDSAATLMEHRSGTGAGRLTEYRNTLKMIGDHPILGVGPGNWRIAYPNYATPGDPNVERGYVPVRRFPQGEWIGIAAERGIPSLLILFAFGGILAWRWLRAVVQERSHRKVGYAYVGFLTMAAVFMVGLFDPVIMTPTAGFVVPVIIGVCAAPFAQVRIWIPTPLVRGALIAGVIVVGTFLVSFPARELWAAMTYGYRPTLEAFERGAKIAPGDYRAHFFAASMLVQRGDCTRAGPYIEAARRLYPTAPEVVQLEERCGSVASAAASASTGESPAASPNSDPEVAER